MIARARSGVRAALRPLGAAGGLAALIAFAPVTGARAGQAGAPSAFSVGLLGGSTFVDPAFADYQWDTRPRADWGALAAFERGRLALGARAWRAATVQQLDLPDGPVSPAVRSTSLELLARVRVATLLGMSLHAQAATGGRRIDYRPDQIEVATGVGSPIRVALEPVDAWVAGAGLALRRPLGRRWVAGVSLDRQMFALDTAHRRGTEVVMQRESFGDWSVRLEVARLFPLGTKGASR